MQNTNNILNNTFVKGLVTDLDAAVVGNEYWTHLRNGINNSKEGRLGTITNEPSNYKCVDLPYTPIGFCKVLNNRWVVFSTDNSSSEIGIFDESKCTYTKLVNAKCLNFKTANLIKATFKENFDCSETVYWTDAVNPRRKINLNNVPYLYTFEDDACKSKIFTDQLDCEALLVTPNVGIPEISVQQGSSGAVFNGAYQVGMAYTVNKERVTNYYGVTQPQSIWSHENFGRSLVVNVDNLDRSFDEYELVLIYTVKNTTTAKTIGFYPTSVTRHEITNVDRPEYITVPLSEITIDRPYYFGADDLVSNDQYLLWSGVKGRPELNYQPQAMNIRARWVMYRVPADYYAKGGNKKGYYRDEVYAFGIQWLFRNGEWSNTYHIPGRLPKGDEDKPAVGKDVYETEENRPLTFEVRDTSGSKKKVQSGGGERPVYEGDMSYWQSTETYPDNQITFGDQACTFIRHHKFPSECKANRYERGGAEINILGVKFLNIEHPKDKNGNKVTDVIGYRIVRSDRSGNRTIISRGVFTNVRSYNETLNQQGNGQEVLYSNYPYNDLRTDSFISSKQTFYRNNEQDYVGLAGYKQDAFNFYSPNTLFTNVGLGDQVIFDTEEIGDVLGNFEDVYNHPRAKTLRNSVFWLALTIGAIDGVLSIFGKKCVTTIKDGVMNVTVAGTTGVGNVTYATAGLTWVQQCEGIANSLRTVDILKLPPLEAVAKLALKTLQNAAKAGMGVYFAFNTANEVLKTIVEFLPWEKHAMQYNSHAFFNTYKCVGEGNTRRHIDFYQYLFDGINNVKGVTFNNNDREKSVYIKLNNKIENPTTIDNTRKTISEAGICNDIYKSFKTKASVFYGAIKRRVSNQYGQLDSINYLDTSYIVTKLEPVATGEQTIYQTDTIFGGDAFISKLSINKSHQFFRQNVSNANFPDGTEYDYSLYRNVGFPRFWLNTEPYDITELIVNGKIPNRLPTNKYNLDCFSRDGSVRSLKLRGVDGKFYLASNGVMQFFVESDYNLDYRDYTSAIPSFYSDNYSNLSEIFRSDRWETKEEFVYDLSFSKALTENAIFEQRTDYDPTIDEKCFTYYKNRVIYSLPAFKEQRGDNWLVYLANNYHDFAMADFGKLTTMQSVDNQQIMFLFDQSSPYVTIGRDELQTENGVKVTIGDAGLFARPPRPIESTDVAYGNSQSKFAFVNTQFGSYYPSQRQGRLFNYTGQIDDKSRKGMYFWFKNYLPSKFLEVFPNFKRGDNTVDGVGLISVFDNTDERYYLIKRDYEVKPEFIANMRYDEFADQLYYGATKIKIGDPVYFNDASFTISYDCKNQSFISWHDWHPEWTIQGEKHFMTVKGKGIWKHNERTDSFCNFYGVDYPFEVGYLVNSGQTTTTLGNIEYLLEGGKYFNYGRDFHHILDINFDRAVIFNTEQISGYLKMVQPRKNSIQDRLEYPKLGIDEFIVKYDKEEHKIRLQQFWDITKDRGEFTHRNYPLWSTSPNGYVKSINDQSVNYNKSIFQRKKFRHMQNQILLIKDVCADTKMIFKFANARETLSPR